MRGEISYIKVYQEEKTGDSSKIQGKQELTKEQCQEMIVKSQNEESKRQTYLHMIDRIKKDCILF